MSIDCRTRRHIDLRQIGIEEAFEQVLPAAVARNSRLAARGITSRSITGLRLQVADRGLTLRVHGDRLELSERDDSDCIKAELSAEALSKLLQDQSTTMGLAMQSLVKITRGDFEHWISWEPVFRALLDGRPVHEPGAISLHDQHGNSLDTTRKFTLDDDRSAMQHQLQEAGFLHIQSVFSGAEMAQVSTDLDRALSRATPDDGASWWAEDASGKQQAVRVLWFNEQSDMLQKLLHDERLQWLAALTDDGHDGSNMSAEGLLKPLHIRKGLSDLPWHKDCGQGGHSLQCNGLTVGISVTGADSASGALGVVPGSHRANVQIARLDPSLDLAPVKLETLTGDITVHCSDTLHRAHSPSKRTRQVVYTSFQLPPLPGDSVPAPPRSQQRQARAKLTDVQDRIAGAGS
ncbi:hypothetical protein EYC98_21130 [Halieaceae bacterium IMCC14734]|uniref:Phytanoyl-CoA dioxygenase n=1 Tax=Candidatus Litorirhabdus singularis TaxID=2518993 RepID=A0ABT3TPW1_9GAMM|nr:phytanoyl-CoA dioxygenase family protein [Candidatus Litorirhabdus singularis]MCX2983372.1 hypothetical protein [Candidatus Litorirhabdus singularis]